MQTTDNQQYNGGGGKLSHSQWKAFYFTEVFTEIQRGKRLKKADHAEGESPYVSSTSLNNGVDGFIGNESGVRIFSDCITVANSGSVGSAFFHRYAFVASDHVTQLKREGLDKYAYLFMLPLISRLSEKYSFNREINDERIKREKLLLPVDDNGEIDFTFMSSFMKDVECDILDTALKMFNGRINVNKSKRGGVKWKEFNLTKWFTPVKGNQNNMAKLSDGNIPLVSAKKCDNGYKCFVGDNGKRLFEGNIITLNNDGDGGAGLAYYQPYKMALDSHVTALIPKVYLNYYTLCFVTMCISKQREKFGHGYSLNNGRIKAFKFMLPINANNTPDWSYMENYMRNIENEQILLYLNTINRY